MRLPFLLMFCLAVCMMPGCSTPYDTDSELSVSTNINFVVQEDSAVRIRLFNAYDTKITDVFNEQLEEGVYSVQLVMEDASGTPLPEGLYYYSLEVGEESISRWLYLEYLPEPEVRLL